MSGVRTIPVDLPATPARNYEVRVGRGVAREAAASIGRAAPGARRVLVVADGRVPVAFVDPLLGAARDAGFDARVIELPSGEKHKSLAAVERICVALAGLGAERRDAVLAVGGGVIGDVAGFAASAYRRGVAVVQCPTTLLAMVDASVGGKTGVNLEAASGVSADHRKKMLLKNFVGAFHQPALVAADLDALPSLPPRDFRSGLAECVKHGMIAAAFDDPGLLAWTAERSAELHAGGDAETLAELVERNVRVKAAVVGADERETAASAAGGRALLNLGHTFGHAIETLDHLSPDGTPGSAPLLHGEAIAVGIVAAHATAEAMGLVDGAAVDRAREILDALGLPVRLAGLPADGELAGRMMQDKKTLGGVLRLVLPEGPGVCGVHEDPPESAVAAGWAAVRSAVRSAVRAGG